MPEPEDYEHLSKEQLLERLRELRSDPRLPERERLIHELQVHQVELEMQNRELRETQEQLLDSGTRYANLYDFAPVAYCTLDEEERIEDANLAAAALFQIERSSLIGRTLFSIVPPESRKGLRESLHRCFENRERGTLELTVSSRAGEPVVAQVAIVPVIDARKVAVAARITLTDVSALKRSEQMLGLLARASEILGAALQDWEAIAEVVDLLVPGFADLCLLDVIQPGGGSVQRIRSGESRNKRLLPPASALLPPGSALLPPGSALLPPESALLPPASALRPPARPTLSAKVLETHKAILITGASDPARREVKLDPSLINASSVLCAPLSGRGGQALGTLTLAMIESGRSHLPADVAFAQDVASRITAALERGRLYREARQAVEAREQVLAVVSHDLRTPLSSILLASRGLQDSPASSNPLALRLLESIEHGVERMSRMIDDLLDVSSIDAGHLSLDAHDQDAANLIDDAFNSLRPMTREKRLRLTTDPPDPGVTVRCDRERVLQVFSNLIGNAIKFTPRGGSISIEATVSWSDVQLAVRDTGPGVDSSLLPHLFERYSQAKATAKRGRGLGLYICKGIVEAHGGRIWAESGPKNGLTVFFTLPRPDGAAASPGREPAKIRREGVVMIVDDDDGHRRALADILQAAGYAVAEAEDGLDALEKVRSGQPLPTVILLDLQMPRMDGWDLMLQLKKDPALASIPVVLVSGFSRLGAEAKATGARGYLRKPVRADHLLEAIDRCRAPTAPG